jgi:hypothetical protein
MKSGHAELYVSALCPYAASPAVCNSHNILTSESAAAAEMHRKGHNDHSNFAARAFS